MMAKELEIERRFLLKKLPHSMWYDQVCEITQYYLPNDEDGYTVRIRKQTQSKDTVFFLTKKKCVSPTVNEEIESEISREEFFRLKKDAVTEISKIRYKEVIEGLLWEIDVFVGLTLIIAEIELPSEDYALEIPEIIADVTIMEVSGVRGFYNKDLSIPVLYFVHHW